MGITISNAAFLLMARDAGANFERTLTLGRLRFYAQPERVYLLAQRLLQSAPVSRPGRLERDGPSNAFFESYLGARCVESMDASGYEGASIIHDLNIPVAADLKCKYDAVVDSGTLEHIFNFPVALAGCMEMVRPGGRLFISTPTNNACGHGFYQFSPELFFRVLSPVNGFKVKRMILVTHPFPGAELSDRHRWYEVTDPAVVGARGCISGGRPAFLMIEAARVSDCPVLSDEPHQSDYAALWKATPERRYSNARRALYSLPPAVRNCILGWRQLTLQCNLRNRRMFRRVFVL